MHTHSNNKVSKLDLRAAAAKATREWMDLLITRLVGGRFRCIDDIRIFFEQAPNEYWKLVHANVEEVRLVHVDKFTSVDLALAFRLTLQLANVRTGRRSWMSVQRHAIDTLRESFPNRTINEGAELLATPSSITALALLKSN